MPEYESYVTPGRVNPPARVHPETTIVPATRMLQKIRRIILECIGLSIHYPAGIASRNPEMPGPRSSSAGRSPVGSHRNPDLKPGTFSRFSFLADYESRDAKDFLYQEKAETGILTVSLPEDLDLFLG